MIRLISAFLIIGAFACGAPAQFDNPKSDKELRTGRHKVLAGWLGIVRKAESTYKSRHGVYGDLSALRREHLLDPLVFESNQVENGHADTNLVPKNDRFELTTSADGGHYKISIWESLGEWSLGVHADENGTEFSSGHHHDPAPPAEDSPDGPLLTAPG